MHTSHVKFPLVLGFWRVLGQIQLLFLDENRRRIARQSPSGDAHLVSLNRQWSQLGCGGPTIDPGRMALGSLGAARGAARAGGWGARVQWFVVLNGGKSTPGAIDFPMKNLGL